VEFDVRYFQSTRSRHAVCNRPHFLLIKRHLFSNLWLSRPANSSPTKKWACAHWCASTIPKNYDTTVFNANYTPARAKRQTRVGLHEREREAYFTLTIVSLV
jgi:hypothetical protein